MAEHMDKIHIRDLLLRCIVGIYPRERTILQDVQINITLHADCRDACRSDQIEDTVNYKEIRDAVQEMVEASSFLLIERLAEEIATICLRHDRVTAVTVRLDKPGALRFAQSVAIEIHRTKHA